MKKIKKNEQILVEQNYEYPTKLRIIEDKNNNVLRLRYTMGTTTVTTRGFQTKQELLYLLKREYFFDIIKIPY